MTHTNLYKNEIYLIVTSIVSIVSIGVLGGYDYSSLALAVLLILPIINLPNKKIFRSKLLHSAIPLVTQPYPMQEMPD